MEKNEVKIQSSEAEIPKIMPKESTFSAKDMPGEMENRVIAGYLPWSTLGSIDITMANFATAAIIVHDSRTFGR